MQQYIGTKLVQAEPKDKQGTPGYVVVYPDGYVSWSPKEAFDEAYRAVEGLSFGLALEALKKGLKVARAGWNGKGMWLSMSGPMGGREIQAQQFWSNNNFKFASKNGGSATVLPCITMKTATNEILMGWLASQSDMLADDWSIVE